MLNDSSFRDGGCFRIIILVNPIIIKIDKKIDYI
jgi:hypothetical protein